MRSSTWLVLLSVICDLPTATHLYLVEQLASFSPMPRKIVIAGHQLVRADWKKLSPTNAVNQSQFGE
jgi:hypothetical protein